MPRINVKNIKTRVNRINDAWTEGALSVEFSGIKQTDFQQDITSAAAIESDIADLETQIQMKKDERDQKYSKLQTDSVRVSDGVKGDKNFGSDSPVYGAMGFVIKSQRASGLTRKKKSFREGSK
jgi:hypothetical protein